VYEPLKLTAKIRNTQSGFSSRNLTVSFKISSANGKCCTRHQTC